LESLVFLPPERINELENVLEIVRAYSLLSNGSTSNSNLQSSMSFHNSNINFTNVEFPKQQFSYIRQLHSILSPPSSSSSSSLLVRLIQVYLFIYLFVGYVCFFVMFMYDDIDLLFVILL
jgi:hypothetical protein